MKVSEAKAKVCPFIQNIGEYSYQAATGVYEYPSNINCICGDCMAWQWTKVDFVDANQKEGYCKRLQS